MRTRIALMAKPCAVCSKVLKEAYISSARKVWEPNATRDSDSEPA